MTPEVETELTAVTIVGKLVLDVSARDRLIARHTDVARSITGVDSSRHHHRQPTGIDALAHAQP